MNSGILFILGLVVMATLAMLYVFKTPNNAIKYFSTEKGKKVLKGIVMFIGIGLLVVLAKAAFAVEYFAYGDVYLGLDQTQFESPMCYDDGANSHLTSNGGFIFNIVRTDDKLLEFNSKYTHHSCAFNSDNAKYDAVGLEFKYRFFGN